MTVKELKTLIARFEATHKGEGYKDFENFRVTIPIHGMGGPHREIKSMGVGFDWYAGQLVLKYEGETLSAIQPREFDFYFMGYVRKNSNLNRVLEGATLARWKKEEKQFEKRWDAELWIYEKAREASKK